VAAAKAGYLSTIAAYQDAIISLSAEVARTYIVIRTYEGLIRLAEQNVGVQEEGQRIAQARQRLGATSELDVAQATNLLETTRASIPELRVGLQQAKNALCTLLDRPTGCSTELLGEAGEIPSVPGQVAVSLPAELLRRRPDVRAAELRAVAGCDRIGIAKAELFPSLSLFGSVSTRSLFAVGAPTELSSLTNLFGVGSLFYSFGASLFFPLLSYPKIFDNVRVQDARFQQLLFDYRTTVRKAAQEVEDGIAGFLFTQEAAGSALAAVTAAELAVKLSMTQYQEGAVDYQRVLDAERSLLSSQNRLASVRSTVATYLVALYKALGGGWQLREGEPVVADAVREEMQKRTHWGSYFKQMPQQKSAASPEPR
jgi:NodT family efflux transporter outer membrane factor (OMF) lipoprotein